MKTDINIKSLTKCIATLFVIIFQQNTNYYEEEMDKQIILYSHNGIIQSNEKE